MQAGDPVIAIGNAQGEGKAATAGIVSANNKIIEISNNTVTAIQTDATINSGSSGGPLINLEGQVIGINTAQQPYAGTEGIGYSITSNTAKPILDKLIQQEFKPFLGIQGEMMTEYEQAIVDLPASGVFVQEVIPGSSAYKAGIERADVITGFNGQAIFDMEQLTKAIQECQVGDEVIVKVYRKGEPLKEVKVKLTEYNIDNF
jgi:serine protease Do